MMIIILSLLPRTVPVSSTVMQKSIWLLAFLACLLWLGLLVDGAAVIALPSNDTHLVHPHRLNFTDAIPGGIIVIDKERGSEQPAAQIFENVIWLMAVFLGPEDFSGFIPSQAWSSKDYILGVSVDKEQGVVQRPFVMYGFYFISLLMKQEKDFRSGVFEIQYGGIPICDLVILPKVSSGLKLAPSFTHVTQLDPPPSPTADNTNGFSQLAGWEPWVLQTTKIMPFLIHPMDELGQLISIMDMLVTAAKSPENERVQKDIESIVPNSGVKISLSLAPNDTPNVLTYGGLVWALYGMADSVPGNGGQGLRGRMSLRSVYLGEITLVPSNSSPPTNPLIEAIVNASMGTATSR